MVSECISQLLKYSYFWWFITGSHVVQFRGLLDGLIIYPCGIFASGCGIQSVSIYPKIKMHVNPQILLVITSTQAIKTCRTETNSIY
jgi:hypothetical protein